MSRRFLALLSLIVLLLLASIAPFNQITQAAHNRDGRIVGGQPVPARKYPFIGILGQKEKGTTIPYTEFSCMVSLIAPTKVLTAGHCAPASKKTWKKLVVYVGLSDLIDDYGEEFSVVEVDRHPKFNSKTAKNDVAVLTLDRPVEGVTPANITSLGTPLLNPGTMLTIAGFGSVVPQPWNGEGNIQALPQHMYEAQVPVLPTDRCIDILSVHGKTQFIPDSMLCAGSPGIDTCNGDSGSAAFVMVDEVAEIVGITSWGFGCADTKHPGGAYTNVPAYSEFILQAMNT